MFGVLISHKSIKYTQKHLSFRKGKRDFILNFQLNKSDGDIFYIFYVQEMSLARGILIFLSFFWAEGGRVDVKIKWE